MTEAEQNRLITENMELVPFIAADYRGGEVEFEDLIAAGREGLVKAARSFDPELGRFSAWASTHIKNAIWGTIRSAQTAVEIATLVGDSIEKVAEWDAWGDRGNANAICERWLNMDASPEELGLLFEDIEDKRSRFTAAFISLTQAQRKLVAWVFLDSPTITVTQAARELGVSYFQATRMLKRALKTMREVITRMENNKTNSGGNANEHPSSMRLHGSVPGSNAAYG